MPWTAPEGASEEYYAGLPFAEAQIALAGTGSILADATRSASCGWHGTLTDPNRGSFAVVREDGPLADLVGERLRVTYGGRQVYVYVTAERDVDDDLSLARRAFAALAPLASDRLTVVTDVVL